MSLHKLPNTLTILLGFGGSGGKTIRSLAELLTNNPASARFAHERIHTILCDTDEGDLRRNASGIERAFSDRAPGLRMQVEVFSLSSNTDIFCDLVQSRIDGVSEAGMSRLREHWWFEGKKPFSATGLPLSTSAGAGQCPLVSHFLAWDKLAKFPEVLERIDAIARNERHMEDYSIDLVLVAGLAGGTGRGCWQLLSFKAREHFGRNGQACRPYGFFFDQSVFEDIQRGRPEQSVKLRINSLTGLSELAMWLRSDRRMPGDPPATDGTPPERRFRLPGFTSPENEAIDVLDTDRYIPEHHFARVGRSPIHKAYVFTNESSSTKVQVSDDVYQLCAAAIYGRIAVTQTRSTDANQPARAAATATSILYVPASNIRKVILNAAKAERARAVVEGRVAEGPGVTVDRDERIELRGEIARNRLNGLGAWLKRLLSVPTPDDLHLSMSDPSRSGTSIAEELAAVWDDGAQSAEGFKAALRTGDAELVRQRLLEDITPQADGFSHDFLEATRRSLRIAEERWEEMKKSRKGRHAELSRLLDDAILAELANANPNSIQQVARDSGNSIASALQAIRELIQVVQDARLACQRRRKENDQSDVVQSQVKGIMDAYLASRRLIGRVPVLGGTVVPRLSARNEKSLLDRVAQARRVAAMSEVLHLYESLLDRLLPRLEQWKMATEDAVHAVRDLSRTLDATVEREIGDYFTRTDRGANRLAIGQSILEQLRRDESAPVNRLVRRLRPVYSPDRFRETVRETLAECRGLESEQAIFIEELLGPRDGSGLADERCVFFAESRDSVSDRQRFRNRVRQQMETILAKQDAPDDAVRNFTLPKVLDGLMRLWFDLYVENQGDEAFVRELDTLVSRLTGISFTELKSQTETARQQGRQFREFEPPGLVQLLARTALKLGENCDPLVRVPPGHGESGDLVTIFVPDESFGAARDTTEPYRHEIERTWVDFRNEFRHVRAERLVDDPFMLVATSDHPKRDFDQHGWSGWTSFDYHYLDTALTDWLDMVADEGGKSVFLQGKDDSIGLGFLHPAYVKDAHWARRRWRPWFNEQKRKTLDRRKWEALAYGLLGNDMYALDGKRGSDEEFPFLARYRQFLKAVSGWAPVNPDFPKEAWSLPVIRETAGEGGPEFTRPLFTDRDKVGLRCDGLDLRGKPMSRSVRSFMEWFRSDESKQALDRLWDEQCAFARVLAQRNQELYDVLSPEHRQDIRKTLLEYVRRWTEYVRRTIRRPDDLQGQVAFLEEFERVLTDPNFDLLKPFNGIQNLD